MAEPNWYPDPENPSQLRYFDGTQWTDQVHPASAPKPKDSNGKKIAIILGAIVLGLICLFVAFGLIATMLMGGGQRDRARNAHAMSAVTNAFKAARAHYTQNETYAGLDNQTLNRLEPSLNVQAPSPNATAGEKAEPTQIWIVGEDKRSPLAKEGNLQVIHLCAASRGDAIYCIKDNAGQTGGTAYLSDYTGKSFSEAVNGTYSSFFSPKP